MNGDLLCDDCDGPNALWNLVVGGPDAKGDAGGILCPVCFIKRAEAKGLRPTAWKLEPETPPAQPQQLSEEWREELTKALSRGRNLDGFEYAWVRIDVIREALAASHSPSPAA